jgi:hypothetical protein
LHMSPLSATPYKHMCNTEAVICTMPDSLLYQLAAD